MKKKSNKEGVVQRTAGIFKSNVPPLSERELKEAAEQAIADDVMERMERSEDHPAGSEGEVPNRARRGGRLARYGK